MEQKLIRKVLQVDGMTCASCEMRIENKLKKINGIIDARAVFGSSNVYVTYDMNVTGVGNIIEEIEKLDYKVKNNPAKQNMISSKEIKAKTDDKMSINTLIGIGIIILALYVIIKNTVGFNFIPQVSQNMGYGLLFVVGLITSLHCIAMCGGINLSQCVSYKFSEDDTGKLSKLKPSLMYNAGRIISYTVIGGIVGTLGSVVSFSGVAKGVIAILSGVFMVIMGLNMLNIFPWLRKLNPKMPKIFGNKIHNNNGKHGPFFVGLLNGLMPCGPLQAMQIYALGTGSFLAGAGSMFFFSVGTVPLMFGFGAVSSFLSGKFTKNMMKVSAMLVMILGIIMLNRGLSLSGVTIAYASTASSGNVAKVQGNVQVITTTLESGNYTPFTVQKGIPVKWTIKADAKNINGCNGTVTIPKYGITRKLVPGDNEIDFTPAQEGNIPYTCWMGMISSNIKVVSDITKVSNTDVVQALNNSSSSGSASSTTGGCCAGSSSATKFAGGKIPTDDIQVAKIVDGEQDVTITVNDQGYSPAVVVVQKGVKTKIKFNSESLSSCNATVVFPEYKGQLNLQSGQTETPLLTPQQDFTFQCGMGMLHGYVKVVDNINNVDFDQVKKDVENFKPASGGCCSK